MLTFYTYADTNEIVSLLCTKAKTREKKMKSLEARELVENVCWSLSGIDRVIAIAIVKARFTL